MNFTELPPERLPQKVLTVSVNIFPEKHYCQVGWKNLNFFVKSLDKEVENGHCICQNPRVIDNQVIGEENIRRDSCIASSVHIATCDQTYNDLLLFNKNGIVIEVLSFFSNGGSRKWI